MPTHSRFQEASTLNFTLFDPISGICIHAPDRSLRLGPAKIWDSCPVITHCFAADKGQCRTFVSHGARGDLRESMHKIFDLAGDDAKSKGIFVSNRYLPIGNKMSASLCSLYY